MAALNFEIFVDNVLIGVAKNLDEYRNSSKLVEEYIQNHPEVIDPNVRINIVKAEPCKGC